MTRNTQTVKPTQHEAHQTGVDGRRLGAVGEIVGVVVAGGGRGGVRGAVHPQRGVELRAAARQEPVVVGRAAEGGGGGGCSGGGCGCALGAARPVRHRPGNRIAASRSGEKLREEEPWTHMVTVSQHRPDSRGSARLRSPRRGRAENAADFFFV